MKSIWLCVALLIGTNALAQSVIPKIDQEGRKGDIGRMQAEKAMKRFDELDANKDGKLSPEEVSQVEYLSSGFAKYDKNKDGSLTWEEYVGHNRWPKDRKE